ncbi:hypothetical protein CDAR_296651 [Caerostris darwini]|uniref:Uncharacterized protein n=1 Tax=Caerostris darwini TaxID=1538125 RepID=A0AAV4QL71_9ARAC|nr:hypothetical protein CDAR_296651 [Caerostris darwini]
MIVYCLESEEFKSEKVKRLWYSTELEDSFRVTAITNQQHWQKKQARELKEKLNCVLRGSNRKISESLSRKCQQPLSGTADKKGLFPGERCHRNNCATLIAFHFF